MKMVIFWSLSFKIQSQGLEQSETLFLFWKILWFSNNLMQKMTSITHFIYKISHLEVFFKKICLEILTIFKVLANPTKGPVQ